MNFYKENEVVTLDTFIGQTKIIETLKVCISASKIRNEILGHILLSGPIDSGRKTIANAIGQELDSNIKLSTSNEFLSPGDIAAALTNLGEGDVLIIENFDMIKQECMDLLCDAMKRCCLEVNVGKGRGARLIKLDLPKFTLIGITDKNNTLTSKVKDCFYIDITLVDYTIDELVIMAKKWCLLNAIDIDFEAVKSIATYAGGSKRKLTNTLKRARDFAAITNNGVISLEIADKTIDSLSNNDFI